MSCSLIVLFLLFSHKPNLEKGVEKPQTKVDRQNDYGEYVKIHASFQSKCITIYRLLSFRCTLTHTLSASSFASYFIALESELKIYLDDESILQFLLEQYPNSVFARPMF